MRCFNMSVDLCILARFAVLTGTNLGAQDRNVDSTLAPPALIGMQPFLLMRYLRDGSPVGRYVVLRLLFKLVISVGFLFAQPVHANGFAENQIKPIRFGAADFTPNVYREKGKLKGRAVERRRELMREAGLDHTEHFMPQSRLYHQIKRGKGNLDAWLSVDIESMNKLGIPVKPTVFEPLRLHIIGLKNKPPKIQDLRVDTLIVMLGFKYAGLVDKLKEREPAMRVIAVPTHTGALRMLKAGRAPYFIDYLAPALHYAAKMGIAELNTTEIYTKPICLFISKDNAQAEELVERLNQASKRILARRAAAKAIR